MADERLNLIVDLVKETKNDIKTIRDEQIRQGKDISRNTESLDHHIKRTDLLENCISEHKILADERFNVIEGPKKARQFLFSWFVKLGSFAGVSFAVIKLVEYITSK